MPRNEAQTRFELIDPALADRGWDRRTDIRVEETAKPIDIVNHQPRERAAGRTDYVLRRPLTPGAEPAPLAILEAKHEGLPPEHGLQQGKGYRVGQLHHVPFVFSSNGHLFVEYDEATGTTSDLLTTGVNVPRVRNIVFLRYVQSPLLFHQMIGRGTRIDRESGKLMFRIFDYTGATALFGEEFLTPASPEPGPPKPPPPDGMPVQKVRVKGVGIELKPVGNYNPLTRDGRLQRVTPQEYRDELTKQLSASVPTFADFRARWLNPPQREQMLKELRDKNLLPEVISEGVDMEAFDEFDILAALAYGVQPMTRAQRAAKFGDTGPAWLTQLPQPTAKVIRRIVKQFKKAGTGALETGQLWSTIGEPNAFATLRQGGQPADLLRMTKETLFAA